MFFENFQEVKKLSTTFYGFDIWVWSGGWEGGNYFFEITLVTWISTYVLSNWTFFFLWCIFFILIIVLSMRKVMFEDINSYSWAKTAKIIVCGKILNLIGWPYRLSSGYIERVTAWPEGPCLFIHHNYMPRSKLDPPPLTDQP